MAVIADEDAHSADEGENYFISMTDMMVGVLFIFIIMLMVFALNFKTSTDAADEALQKAKQIAAQVSRLEEEIRSEIGNLNVAASTRRQILETVQTRLKERGIDVTLSRNSDVLRINENAVRFEVRASDLDARAKANVGIIGAVLQDVLRGHVACVRRWGEVLCRKDGRPAIETIFIEGHTDERGDDRGNWELSTARAANTYRELTLAAPSLRTYLNRDNQEILSVSGYSSTRAVDPASNEQAWSANRRIDVRFVMENDSRQRLSVLEGRAKDLKEQVDALVQTIGGSR